ncbi:MAG TPA: hypothetical protein VNK43_01875 [Gemmatimonadales bacterium]|nr:hypothetical protein [Gemmatimonadales bacterium]
MMMQVVQQFPVPPDVPPPAPWEVMPPQAVVMIVLAIVAGATLVCFPLFRALARRIEGKGTDTSGLHAELDELRARVAELEAAQARVGELEDRLDFAERLLARRPDLERLGEG